MCSCKNKVKSLNQSVNLAGQKSFNGPISVDSLQKGVKKTREQLIAELRRRISVSTR